MVKTRQQGIKKLFKLAGMTNAWKEVENIEMLGQEVVRMAKVDDDSRESWIKRSKKAMDLALQIVEEKNTPWEGASNIKDPQLTTAALQFHARAYPAIVATNKVVKGMVTGFDADGAKAKQALRIEKHMNYQLLEENEDWEEEMDRLLLALPIEGCEFKKTYFSKALDRNCSDWVRPEDFIVNYKTKSLASCPRMTHRLWFYPHEIIDKQQDLWRDVDLEISATEFDEETPQEFYEQHRLIDLDGDGRKEPWIVTVHLGSEKVVRVVAGFYPEEMRVTSQGKMGLVKEFIQQIPEAEIEAVMNSAKLVKINKNNYFTKFSFLPSPDGGFYDIGFGQLLATLSDAVDTILNILIDSGTLATMQGGFVRAGLAVNNKRGIIKFERGEFQHIKIPASSSISDSIYQLKFQEPSGVLFQLLGMLIQREKDVTGVQDIMSGGPQNEETATTTLSRVEEGMKVFTSIFKRIHRSLKKELKIHYKLNSRFLRVEDYFRVLDTRELEKIGLADYQNDMTDVQPVSDPMAATTVLAMAKAQALLPLKADPTVNPMWVNMKFLEALEIPDIEHALVPPQQPQPDPEVTRKAMESASLHAVNQAKITELKTKAIKNLADAEGKEAGTQLEIYKAFVEGMTNEQGTAQPMEGSGNDQMALQETPGGQGPGAAVGMGGPGSAPAPGPNADNGIDPGIPERQM